MPLGEPAIPAVAGVLEVQTNPINTDQTSLPCPADRLQAAPET